MSFDSLLLAVFDAALHVVDVLYTWFHFDWLFNLYERIEWHRYDVNAAVVEQRTGIRFGLLCEQCEERQYSPRCGVICQRCYDEA